MSAWFRQTKPAPVPIQVDPLAAADKLRAFIAGKSKLIEASELTNDTKLFSSGLLDSLTFVELVLFVEREFHVKLADLIEVNMDSLDSIEQILRPIVDRTAHP